MKVLVIGYGSIGKRHVSILKKLPVIKQIAIVTRQQLDGPRTYKDLNDIDNLSDYDYFIISSETYKHYDQLIYLENHLADKTILVEKPLFHAAKKIDIENNKIWVAYNLRFHPVLQILKGEIEDQKIIYANLMAGQYLPKWRPESDYRNSYSAFPKMVGGVLLDLSHEIDYAQWLFGEFQNVMAFNEKISNLEILSDDIVTGVCKTNKNIIINFTMDYISRVPIRRIIIYCNNKTVISDLIENRIVIETATSPLKEISFPKLSKNYTYIRMHDAILNQKPDNVCTFNEGLSVMQTIERIRLFENNRNRK